MRRERPFRRVTALSPALVLGTWLVGEEIGRAATSDEALEPSRATVGQTVEPLPGVAVSVELGSLEKTAKGGVATLLVGVKTGLDLSEATLSAKAPTGLVFADGSPSRTWKALRAGRGEQVIPVEVIVPRDGAFDISFVLEGTAGGKPIRRGVAYELQVGVETPRVKSRDGAIEYRASPEGGN